MAGFTNLLGQKQYDSVTMGGGCSDWAALVVERQFLAQMLLNS